MNSDPIDFHVCYSTQLKGSVCPCSSVLIVQLPGKHLQMNVLLNKDYIHRDLGFFPLETQHFSQNTTGSGTGFHLVAGRSQLVHGLL